MKKVVYLKYAKSPKLKTKLPINKNFLDFESSFLYNFLLIKKSTNELAIIKNKKCQSHQS